MSGIWAAPRIRHPRPGKDPGNNAVHVAMNSAMLVSFDAARVGL